MKTKEISKVLISIVLLITLACTGKIVYGADGDLDLNVDAIYDDGKNRQNQQTDYEVPDLFLKEKNNFNSKNKKQKNHMIKKAEKSVFLTTKKEKVGHDQKVLRRYLFTSNFSGVKNAGIEKHSSDQLRNNTKTWLIILFLLFSMIFGIWLGIKFSTFFKRKVKDGEDGKLSEEQ